MHCEFLEGKMGVIGIRSAALAGGAEARGLGTMCHDRPLLGNARDYDWMPPTTPGFYKGAAVVRTVITRLNCRQ